MTILINDMGLHKMYGVVFRIYRQIELAELCKLRNSAKTNMLFFVEKIYICMRYSAHKIEQCGKKSFWALTQLQQE